MEYAALEVLARRLARFDICPPPSHNKQCQRIVGDRKSKCTVCWCEYARTQAAATRKSRFARLSTHDNHLPRILTIIDLDDPDSEVLTIE